ALKFIGLTDPKLAQRFLNEARAQARLTHDNICKVYEVDEVAGQPYIAMEFVDGQSVLAISSQLSLVNKVKLMQDIAEALHAAHRIGIIHRDMKPQNVLVEQKADGRLRPVVMDFGLARDVRSRLNLTESGVVLGTPEYMSPEQARGNSGDQRIDARTDVYSLGAMLYELLCGQPPFEGSTSVQVLISVINDEVVPIRARNPAIPDPLDTIVMNCLSKEPEGRYPTARALAEDLGRFLAGEPIHARRPSQSQSRPGSLRPAMTPTPPSQPAAAITQRRLHVGMGATLALGLLVTLAVLVVLVVRYRVQRASAQCTATETQRAAQLFAKDVREFELFMRAAYALPLHNIRR
ncbi:serine/threonine-protein kinase, partial [Haliangium sp. UPWRP_2]|uniref:serine/threonine-protein kinase n=1 Tax=Haliangium sp. UPWRP_2 TaxID=1931276 RepID=UPI0011B24441